MPDKTLPPSIKRALDRSKERKSVAPVPGAREARQAIQGYIGMDPSYSVMDPEAQSLSSAYRSGEAASVLGDLAGALSPLAMASAASKANQVPGLAELIAYHGSPHKFKKFDASKIGTGEGAQAYGHGLYFAENPDVASFYASMKSPMPRLYKDGQPFEAKTHAEMLAEARALGAGSVDEAISRQIKKLQTGEKNGRGVAALEETGRGLEEERRILDALQTLKDEGYQPGAGGNLYKIDIPDEKIAQMLDWDKPLSQQPKAVQEFADKILNDPRRKQAGFTGGKTNAFGEEMTGADFYNTLTPTWLFGGEKGGVEAARQAGIPGIRYLDQGSRGAKQGTRNFVLFPGEEQNIKMLDINGEPQMAKGGAIRMQDGGDPTEMFNFNPMAAKAAKQKQMRESTPETPFGALVKGFGTGLFGSTDEQVPYSGSIMEGSPERQQSQANLRELGRTIGSLTDIGGMVTPFAKPAAQAVTRGATALGRAGLEQVDRAMFGEGPLAALAAPVAPLQAAPRVQAPVSKLGFYDPVEQAGLNIQRKQGPGQAFLNELQRSENVSKDFLEASGIAEKLRAAPNITREEVQKLTKGAVPEIEEVVKGGKQDFDANRLNELESQYRSLKQHPIDDPNFGEEKYNEMIRLMNIRDQSDVSSLYREAERAEDYAREAQKIGDKKLAEAYFRQAELYNTRAEKLDLQGEGLLEPTKYSHGNLQLPGGDNYREVLLKVPKKAPTTNDIAMSLFNKEMRFLSEAEKQQVVDESRRIFDETPREYRSTHWEEPNVVSHIRMNDRTDADGKKVLFIEEIQSDWAQQGRREGFEPKGRRSPKQIETEITKLNRERSRLIDEAAALPDSQMADFIKMNEQIKKLTVDLRTLQDEWDVSVARPNVPRGPFVTNTNEWVDLSLKNILKRAVDEGYDRVAFINGKQSADRYKLTNYVDRIEFLRRSGGIAPGPEKMGDGLLVAYDKEGRRAIEKYVNDPERELPDVIGKEASQKLLEQKPEQTRFAGEGAAKWSLQGAGLEVGGKGMKDFYDRIVPDRLKKIAKQELKSIDFGASKSVPQQLGIDITPEIREKFSKPIPYKKGGAVHVSNNPDTMLLELMRNKRYG